MSLLTTPTATQDLLHVPRKKEKTLGIIQSNYIPWRGYFDFINSVDLFVIYDCLQYTKFDWRNRNMIKYDKGTRWISVPVDASRDRGDTVENTVIKYHTPWIDEHIRWLKLSYEKAPFFKTYIGEFEEILRNRYHTISQLNLALLRWVCGHLGITTQLRLSSEVNPEGVKTDRLLDIMKKFGGTHYLSGPAAKDYIQLEKFQEAKISLTYKSYSYPNYPQLHGDFVGAVTILDLMFNCGPESHKYINTLKENEKVLEYR
ncbi:MAG: hypothetical protein A4S09_02495 [Proteobacteria bacterium SG_bin7]|nr:MAG: hypothetical protein A4S09_02495 [Proteobacteria bacterium SG_bin7]